MRLLLMFIRTSRPESVWRTLRHFGYDEKLQLALPDHVQVDLDPLEDVNWQLNHAGRAYLHDMFDMFATKVQVW